MSATVVTGEVKIKKSGEQPEKSGKVPEKVDEDTAEEEDFSGLDDDDLLAQLGDHGGSIDDDDGELDDISGNDRLDDLGHEEEEFAAMPLNKIRMLHKAVDADGDNKTSLGELLQFSDNMHKETIKVIVPELLAMLDHIKDGKLSLEEILKDAEDDLDLTPEEINNWKELETVKFKLADADNDGFLSVDEVDHMFYPETHEGMVELSVDALIKRQDGDGDGKLNFTEFWGPANETNAKDSETDGLQNPQNHTDTQREHDIFKKLDKDGDGLLNAQELVAWESGRFHTEETLMELLELADVNHDHHLTVEEIEAAKEKIQNIDARLDLVQWIKHLEL